MGAIAFGCLKSCEDCRRHGSRTDLETEKKRGNWLRGENASEGMMDLVLPAYLGRFAFGPIDPCKIRALRSHEEYPADARVAIAIDAENIRAESKGVLVFPEERRRLP
jgi:hypothetical protein